MKAVTIKRGSEQNTSLFVNKKELEELRNYLSEIVDGTKESVTHNTSDYVLIITKGQEDKFTMTLECQMSN